MVRLSASLCAFGLVATAALAPGATLADALDRIAAKGEIVLGHRTDAPPFSYVSDLGEPAGLAIDLCREAASAVRRELGLETLSVRYAPVSAAERIPALTEERIDLLCGPTTQTLARRRVLDFSIPYFIDGSSVVYREGELTSMDDLRNRSVGVLAGTTTEALVGALLEKRGLGGVSRVSFDSHVAGLNALAKGEIAAYFGDQAILRYQIGALRPDVALRFSDEQFSFEPYALAMKRGESRLRLAVDTALSDVFASGDIYRFIDSSMGSVTLSDLALAVYQVVGLPE